LNKDENERQTNKCRRITVLIFKALARCLAPKCPISIAKIVSVVNVFVK